MEVYLYDYKFNSILVSPKVLSQCLRMNLVLLLVLVRTVILGFGFRGTRDNFQSHDSRSRASAHP
jgi:hypothetical protein